MKTYVSTHYRSAEPGGCVCCSDTRGYGHTFCYAIHSLDDKGVSDYEVLRDAMALAGVGDGDEFEIVVRKTGRRPFGDQLMVNMPVHGHGPYDTALTRTKAKP